MTQGEVLSEPGSQKLPIVKLIDNFEASYDYVANDGSLFYFQTNLKAPRYRVVRTDIAQCKSGGAVRWEDVVPQHKRDLLQSVRALQGDNLVVG